MKDDLFQGCYDLLRYRQLNRDITIFKYLNASQMPKHNKVSRSKQVTITILNIVLFLVLFLWALRVVIIFVILGHLACFSILVIVSMLTYRVYISFHISVLLLNRYIFLSRIDIV